MQRSTCPPTPEGVRRTTTPRAAAFLFSWTGALVFVLALGYFVYSYTITFAQPADSALSAAPITWNVTLFTIFAVHHSVFSRLVVRDWVARIWPHQLERPFYVWIASLLFIAVCALWQPVGGFAWHVTGAGRWGLRAVQSIGVVLIAESAAVLDVFELAGVRHSGDMEARRSTDEFKKTGPYGWVRHPIYAGWILLVLAAPAMTMTRLVFAAVSTLYLLIAMPLEERSLRAASSGAYQRYMREVPWRLIPRVF